MTSVVKARLKVLDERLKLLTLFSLFPDVPVIAKPSKGSNEFQKSAEITLFFFKTPVVVDNIQSIASNVFSIFL